MPDFLHNLWRDILFRRRLFALVVMITLLSLLLVSFQLPRGYRAEAWLLLDATPAATNLAPGSTAIRPAAELEIAERQLLSSATLLSLAKQTEIGGGSSELEIIETLRGAIKTRRLFGGNRASLLHITFTHPDPEAARKSVEALARQVLSSDIDRQSARAEQAVRFATQAAARSETELAQLDAAILSLRNKAGDALPDTFQSRLARRADLEAQLRQVAKDRLHLEANSGITGQAEAERILHQLERARQERQRTADFSPDGSSRLTLLDARISELDRQLQAMTSDNKSVSPQSAQINLLARQEVDLQNDLKQLEASLALTPRNAGEMEALQRQRELAEDDLAKTQTALNAARSWKEAIQLGAASRWSLVDVPMAPRSPEGIGPAVLIAGSVVLAFLAGVGWVAAIGQISGTIRCPRQISAIFGAAPLLEIPPIHPAQKASP